MSATLTYALVTTFRGTLTIARFRDEHTMRVAAARLTTAATRANLPFTYEMSCSDHTTEEHDDSVEWVSTWTLGRGWH